MGEQVAAGSKFAFAVPEYKTLFMLVEYWYLFMLNDVFELPSLMLYQ